MEDWVVDLTDLVDGFSHARRPTGIQRVVIAIGGAAIAAGATAARFDGRRGTWLRLPRDPLTAVLALSTSGASTLDSEWRIAMEWLGAASRRADPIAFKPTTRLVTLGAPWGRTTLLQDVRLQRRIHGIRYAAFVHDTVPIDLPEYCDGETPELFREWFYGCMGTADVLIANSSATAACIRKACDEAGLVCPPIVKCRLDGAPTADTHDPPPESSVAVGRILSRRFVLFVATLEPRKNHLGVISAWRKLLVALGDDAPLLVFAGAAGWGASLVTRALDDPRLHGKIIVLSDVTDADLAALYRHCLFTVYNSHWEGWGLPVSESIAHGKVPVVPAHSGLLESGARHAEYFAPDDAAALARVLIRLARDEDYLEARTRDIAAARPRSWQEITGALVKGVTEALADPIAPLPARLEEATLYHFVIPGARQPLSHYRDAAVAEAVRGAGWHIPEDWGCWTSAPIFEIRGQLVPQDGYAANGRLEEDLAIYLVVRGHSSDCVLTVRSASGTPLGTFAIEAGRKSVLRLIWPSQQGPDLDLVVQQSSTTDLGLQRKAGDSRVIGVGVSSLMVSRGSDLAARCRVYENLLDREAIAILGS